MIRRIEWPFGRSKIARMEYPYSVGNDVVLVHIGTVPVYFIPVADARIEHNPDFVSYDDIRGMTSPEKICLVSMQKSGFQTEVEDTRSINEIDNYSRHGTLEKVAKRLSVTYDDYIRARSQAQKIYKDWKLGKIKGDPTL